MDRVVISPVGKDKYEVVKSYLYKDIRIKKGFVTNGADIPRVLWSIFPPNSPEYMSAIVIHDFLCDKYPKVSYKEADKVFYEAMLEIGVAKWKAKLFYVCCSSYHRFKEIIRKDK